MRILLIGNFVPDRQESMLRFANLLADGLRERGHEVITWSPEPRLVGWLPRYRYGGPMKYVGYLDKFVLFPRQLRRRLEREPSVDLVHIVDHANAVYAPIFARRAVVATCHDLLQVRSARGEFPEHRVAALGRRYQAWILSNISRLPHVIVPSTQTATDVHRLGALPLNRITLIPHALNFPYRRVAPAAARLTVDQMLSERGLAAAALDPARGFLLNVGGGQWYKNRRGLLDIYAALRRRLGPAPRLLIVGKALAPELVAQVQRLGLGSDLVHVSNVSGVQLQALYSLAEALIFPSWQEGFGWPIAEAQSCGCPVFTSDRAPMTEIGGDAVVYFDPGDPTAAAERILAAWPDRALLAARGLARAGEWDRALMMSRHVALYERLAAAKSPALAA